MKKLSIAYFGTPYFSALFLEKLLTDISIKHLIEIKFVLTQPDQPVGRKQTLTPSPIKEMANKYKLKIYDQNVSDLKEEIKKLDFVLIYAYGFKQYIPTEILTLPKIKFSNTNSGFVNIHPSLLPLYRGASPIAYPLMLGERDTGVSIFVLDEKMDHGPVLAQEKMIIKPNILRPELEAKLTNLGFEMFKKMITVNDPDLVGMTTTKQNHSLATHARYLTKDDGFIDLSTLKKALNNELIASNDIPKLITNYYTKNSGAMKPRQTWLTQFNNQSIYNLYRGLSPWPGLWTLVNIKGIEKRLKITDMSLLTSKLSIEKVQLEGKKEVDFKTFNSAYSVF